MFSVANQLSLSIDVTNYEWVQRLLFIQHQQMIVWLSNAASPELIGADIDIIDEEMILDQDYNARMELQHGRRANSLHLKLF
jgi:hypothetical protein